MFKIYEKVKYLKKIENIYKSSLFVLSTSSFAMNNNFKGNEVKNNLNKVNNNFNETERLKEIVEIINKNFELENENKKFKLVKLLGEGSCGKVIHVKKDNKDFAIKITKNTKNDNNESKILHKLKHKNIIKSFGSVEYKDDKDPKKNFLATVLEYCKHGDLDYFMKKVLKRRIMSENLVCYIAGQVFNALKYMHTMGIAHYDVKMSNVLVDECLNCKVGDFSVANKINTKPMNYNCKGTRFYMPLEALESLLVNDRFNCFKQDVFAYGVMLYKLFTGKHPYLKNSNNYLNDNGDYDYLKSIEKNDIDIETLNENDATEDFKDFVIKCLEKDVDKRPTIFDLENHPYLLRYKTLLDEKENLYNAAEFLINLMTDHVWAYFKEYKYY